MTSRKKMNFNKKGLEAILPPPQGEVEYADTSCKGLRLIVRTTGSKTFYFRGTFNGTQKRYRIGTFPEFELGEARDRADEMRVMIAKGIDPDAPIKIKKSMPTLDVFFDEYLEQHAKKQKKTWEYDARIYRLHLKNRMGKLRLADITREHVIALQTEIAASSGRAMSNHVLALLTALINKAVLWQRCPPDVAPTRAVKKYPTPARQRRLSPEEMERFLNTLMEEANTTLRDYALISLFTGVRRNNVLSMRWDEIDWKGKVWNIPITKNGHPLSQPLDDILLAVLQSRRLVVNSEFVFPSDSRSGHMHEIRKSWKSFLNRAEIQNLTRHDLRRTFASWLGKMGVNSFAISKSLGQTNAKSAEAYTHLNVEDVGKVSKAAILDMLNTVITKEKT